MKTEALSVTDQRLPWKAWHLWGWVHKYHAYLAMLQRNSLYRAVRFAKFVGILGFSAAPIILADLLGNTFLLARVQKVISCDSWISIRFVCSVFQGSLLCDCAVSGNNQLVTFASQIFLTFLILVTCKNKATSASFLWQKIHSLSRFPSLFLSSLESFSAKLGKHVTLWFALARLH